MLQPIMTNTVPFTFSSTTYDVKEGSLFHEAFITVTFNEDFSIVTQNVVDATLEAYERIKKDVQEKYDPKVRQFVEILI